MALLRGVLNSVINNHLYRTSRLFSIYPRLQLKEITEKQEGSTLIIQGHNVPSSREPFLLHLSSEHVCNNACAICNSGLDIKHTDVLILSQFVRSDGCMLPRRITNLCKRQQKRVATMVAMAQKAGLMSNLTPETSKKDPKLRKKWKKYNIYFDESTIKTY